jgi:hypothetical protein
MWRRRCIDQCAEARVTSEAVQPPGSVRPPFHIYQNDVLPLVALMKDRTLAEGKTNSLTDVCAGSQSMLSILMRSNAARHPVH